MRGNTAPYAAVGGYPLPLGFNGRMAWIYRWFSGRPLNGHRYTDATGFRYGTMALDVSGHATPYQLLPGGLRFLYVRLPIMLILPAILATLIWPMFMYYAFLATVLLATWRIDRWRKRAAFRRDVIEPVSAGVSAVLQSRRVAGQGHTWVSVPADFRDNPEARIEVKLPMDWVGREGDKAALLAVVAAKLNCDELTPQWSLHGSVPTVSLIQAPAPPTLVLFSSAREVAESVGADEIMLGVGARGKVETFSLLLESPHAILNGGSGAGKSVLLAFMVAQFMRRGAGVMVLDAKFVSHMWLRRVPGVHYASETEDMHHALCWLDNELLRRARLVSTAPDMVAAKASLRPLVVVMEEMTAARGRLDRWWKANRENGDPALSPALAALANVANMGRELKVYAFLAGQSLTARVTGGPEGRESYGARLLARATSNAWRMLAPQIKPAPVKRGKPGAWHIVVGDTLRSFQAPYVDLESNEVTAELIAWACGGVPGWDVTAALEGWEPEPTTTTTEAENPSSEVVGGVSLREYAVARGLDLGRLREAKRSRTTSWPQPVGTGPNRTDLYSWEDLDAFVAQWLREPAEG